MQKARLARSLRSQWFTTFWGSMVFVSLGLAAIAWWGTNRLSRWQVEERLRSISQIVARPSYPLSHSVLKSISALTDATLVLVDGQGRIVAASNSELVESRVTIDWAGGRQELAVEHDWQGPDGQAYHVAWSPFIVTDAPQRWPAKWIGIWMPAGKVRQMRVQAVLLPLATGLTTALVISILAAWLTNRVVGRMERLQHQVQRIAAGNFEEDATEEPLDEIGNLHASVNRMAVELRGMKEQVHAVERDRLLHSMATGLSHDLRNTLTGARLAIQVHAKQQQVQESESIVIALRQLRLAEEQLQRFMRLDGDDWRDSPAKLGPLLQQIREMVEPIISHQQSRLEMVASPEVAEFTIAHSEWLRSALLNLVLNAVQAAGHQGEVILTVARLGNTLSFTVRDSGPGPDPAIADRMFEPMVTGKPEGVGLGLALVAKAAEKMGGSIEWRREDKATCFELTLPWEVGAKATAD